MKKIGNQASQGSQMILMMVVMFGSLMMFQDENIMRWIQVNFNAVFYPLIGFDGGSPVLTIILAGVIVTSLSSFFNNLFMDWKEMGKAQEASKAFQKEITKARKEGNQNRVNKLMKLQPQIMKKQTEAQSGMMKPMIFLFVFIVPIFIWLRFFLGNLDYYYLTVPWGSGVSLFYKPFLMQTWLWVYLMFSMVVGQMIRGGLKYITWSDQWKNIRGKIIPSRHKQRT